MLHALRRRYPQIYFSKDKLELNLKEIVVNAQDFRNAIHNIVPASQRSLTSPARALTSEVKPLLSDMLRDVVKRVGRMMPAVNQVLTLEQGATSSQLEFYRHLQSI